MEDVVNIETVQDSKCKVDNLATPFHTLLVPMKSISCHDGAFAGLKLPKIASDTSDLSDGILGSLRLVK